MFNNRKSMNAMMLGASMMAMMASSMGSNAFSTPEDNNEGSYCKRSVKGAPKKLKKKKKGNYFIHSKAPEKRIAQIIHEAKLRQKEDNRQNGVYFE